MNLSIKALGLDWLLLVAIAALLPTYLLRLTFFGIPTNVLEVLIGAAFLTGVLSSPIRISWRSALTSLPKPVLFSVSIFLFSAVLSTAISPHPETSLGILKGWILIPMLYGFMVYAALETRNWKLEICQALIFSGLVVALFGLSQLGQLDRIQSVFAHPNSLALFLAPIIIMSTFLPLTKGVVVWSAAAIMFLALLLTQSLAGALSILIVIGVFGFLRFWHLKLIWILAFGFWIFIAAVFLQPKIAYLLQPNSSVAVRLQLWSISADLIKDHPLLGIGLGTFEPAYQEKLHERFARYNSGRLAAEPLREFVFRDPHNWLLSFWLNTGLLGLLSFTFLNGYVIFWSLKNWSLIRNWKLEIGNSAALALLALAAFGFVDTIFWKNDLSALHFLLLALILSSPTPAPPRP